MLLFAHMEESIAVGIEREWACFPQKGGGAKAAHLVGVVDLVVLEDMEFDLLLGVLDLLRLGVGLLLALLASSTETENEVKGGLLLDVVVLEGAAVLKLLASEDETLLVRGDALLVLDLGLDSLNGVSALDLQGWENGAG